MSRLNGKGKDGGALVVVNRIVNTGPVVGFGVAVESSLQSGNSLINPLRQ